MTPAHLAYLERKHQRSLNQTQNQTESLSNANLPMIQAMPSATPFLYSDREYPCYPQAPYVPPPPCHEEGKHVFSLGKSRIHAGGIDARKREGKPWDLVINLTGNKAHSPEVEMTPNAKALVPFFACFPEPAPPYPEVTIHWPDGHVPQIRRKEWRKLVADLQAFDGDVLIHCHGGHGRTGTLLTILADLGKCIPGDIVLALRESYCHKIVETLSQITYLEKNMQIRTKAQPRWETPMFSYPQAYTGPREQGVVISDPAPTDAEKSVWPTTVSSWYEDYKAKRAREASESPQMFRCDMCNTSKQAGLMSRTYLDGMGVCKSCNNIGRLY